MTANCANPRKELLNNGWRAIVEGLPSLRNKPDGPIIHLWLVPGLVFAKCVAGPLQFASAKEKATMAKLPAENQAAQKELNAAIERARGLAPFIVQYAVELPLPDADFQPARRIVADDCRVHASYA